MKAVRTAALVVGAVALVATGIGAAVKAGIIGATAIGGGAATFAGATAATWGTIGTLGGVAAGITSLASVALASGPKGTLGGNPTLFKIDKDAGVPYAMGRTFSGGNVVHRQHYGPKNSYESWAIVHSLGPIDGYESLKIDNATVTLNGTGGVTGTYAGYMFLRDQLGACPESAALTGPFGAIPRWDASSKLSGLAAEMWTLKFDTEGKKFPAGVPKRGRVLRGVKVYDARLDSTYPGGSGPCRLGDESTYVYSECPAWHAATYAYGRVQNGQLVAGGGLPVSGIILSMFVDWANVCDANGWKVGGIVYVTSDNDWDILKMIAQAGGGEVAPIGGQLGCFFSAPRVAIGTITAADIMGDVDIPAGATRSARINGIIPRIRSEAHGWEMVPLDAVRVDDWVTLDGRPRTREVTYPLVQDADQAAELALYDIVNARELDGAVIPCKLYMIDYRPGDCLTANLPEANLIDRDVIVRTRELDMGSLGVTFGCRSETAEKHDLALGATGTAPPIPSLDVPDLGLIDAPAPGAWSLAADLVSGGESIVPALVVTGAHDNPNADFICFEYRPYSAGQPANEGWIGASFDPPGTLRKVINGVLPETAYEVAISYRVRGPVGARRILGPVTTGAGTEGPPGASVAELTIYRASASAPATPTGGSFNVATRVLTPPSGWSLTMPTSGTRWSASGYAAWSGTSGTVTPTWFGVGGGISNGTDGDDGVDGQATDVIFRRAATQPATPPDSSGIPAGWYGTTGEVPASADPMWASFRTRATSASAWVHQAPRRVEGLDAINNVNRMRNTLFERGLQGWEMLTVAGVTITAPLALDIVGDARTLSFTATATASGQQAGIDTPAAYRVPVNPEERLSVQALCRSAGVVESNLLRVQFYDAAGAQLAGTGINVHWLAGAQASFALMSGFVTVPAGASTMLVGLRTFSSGAGSFSGRLCKPMVASATATQTLHPPFTPGVADGEKGADGADAKVVRLTASALGFLVASSGANTPASITLTASGQAVTGSPVFTVVAGTATLTGTGTSRALAYADMVSDVVSVQVFWGGVSDTITLYKMREGSNSLYRIASNEAHSFPTNSAGNVTDYAGSGTQIRIFEGVLPMTFHTALAPGRFTVGTPVVSPPGAITVGALSGSGTNVCTVADHSAASAAASAIIITYPITVQRANGAIVSLSLTQSLTKPKDGQNGAPGVSALSATALPSPVTVPAYFNGTPKSSPPAPAQIRVFRASTDVTGAASYAIDSSSNVTGAAVSGGGLVSITGLTAESGEVIVSITYDGALAKLSIPWVKNRDGNSAVSGSASVTSLGNTSTYAVSAAFNVSLADGQTFSVNSSGTFQSSAGAYRPQLKLAFQNTTDGGPPTDMAGSEVTAETAFPLEPEVWVTSGSVQNTSGGTKVFSIRLMSRRIEGAGNSAVVSGTVGGSGS